LNFATFSKDLLAVFKT